MQYVEGRTLKHVINKRPLDFDSLYSIAIQTADAIVLRTEKESCIGDIKSSNIMITERGQG